MILNLDFCDTKAMNVKSQNQTTPKGVWDVSREDKQWDKNNFFLAGKTFDLFIKHNGSKKNNGSNHNYIYVHWPPNDD